MKRVIEACLASTLLFGCGGGEDEEWALRGATEGHVTTSESTGKHESTGEHEDTGKDKGCVRTQGYWKTHNDFRRNPSQDIAWPISENTLLCGQTWLEWMQDNPDGGDAYVILVHQWIAAMLNVASGADDTDIADELSEAGAILASCTITDREEAIELAGELDDFNNGLLGVPHCDGEAED